MAEIPFSGLTQIGALTAADLFAVVDADEPITASKTKHALLSQLDTYLAASLAATFAAATHVHDAADVTTGAFADARISQTSVTQHQAALSVTESQISDLQAYALSADLSSHLGDSANPHSTTVANLSDTVITALGDGEVLVSTGVGTSWINQTLAEAGIAAAVHAHAASDVTSGTFADARISQTSVTQHQAALSIAESQIVASFATFAAAGHNHTLDGLSNVTITTIASGEILKWSGSAWINNTLAEAGIAAASHTHTSGQITDFSTAVDTRIAAAVLDDLSDVTETAITTGDVLRWSGTAWVNYADSAYATSGHNHTGVYQPLDAFLTDIAALTDPGADRLLFWDDSGTVITWLTLGTNLSITDTTLNATGGGAAALDDLTDVTITTATTGDLLRYSGTAWVNYPDSNYAASGHNHTLDSLSNVTITTIGAGEILAWSGSAWINQTLTEAGIQPLNTVLTELTALTDPSAVRIAYWNSGTSNFEWLTVGSGLQIVTGVLSTTAGGGSDYYANMTDGTATSSASGADTFKFRSANNLLTVAVTNNDATHGDNLLLTVNQANISITASQVSDFGTAADARIAAAVLDDLSDVTETAITTGDLLRWSGTAWVNYADSNYAAASHTHTASQITDFATSVDARIGAAVLDDLADVVETVITTGDLLRWNGTNWVNYADSNFAASTHQHSAADITSGTLAETVGGTGQSTYAVGDTLYSDATNSLAKLAGNITTTRQFLSQTGTGAVSQAPVWVALQASDIPDLSGTYQPLDATLTSIAALGTAADRMLYTTAVDTWAEVTTTSFGRGVLSWADAAAGQTALNVDPAGTDNSTNVTVAAGLDYLSINGAGQIITLAAIDLATDISLASSATGDVVYFSGANVIARLAGNITTARQFLISQGTGAAAQAPSWGALQAGDIPDLSATYQPLDAFLTDISALTDPGADRLLFWDDTAGSIVWLTLGTNLSITDTTINAAGGGGSLGSLSDVTLTSQATGDLLYADSASSWANLAAGTNGYILTSNGPGVAPSWQAATGGGNVSSSGTPADGQIGVWVSATGIEGDPALTFDTTSDTLSTVNVLLTAGGALQTATGAGNTLLLQAYDVDGVSYTTFATLTANNTPTMDLSTAVTIGGNAILDSTWTGSTNVTTLGTIGTGVWQGTAIDELYGGTGFTTYATGDILYASATNTLSKLAATTNGFVLTLAAGVPTWAASAGGTPTAVTRSVTQTTHGFAVGDVVRVSAADTYTKAQADTAANAEVAGVVSAVADANNFTLTVYGAVTSGVPAGTAGDVLFLSTGTAGALTATEPSSEGNISKPVAILVTSASVMFVVNMRGMIVTANSATGLGGLSDVTITGQATGDIIYATSASAWGNLAVGAATTVLTGGTTPSWAQVSLTTMVTGTLGPTNGGTGVASYTTGDILYASASNTLAALAAGTSGYVLTSNGPGVAPSWQAAAGGGSLAGLSDVTLTTPDQGAILYKSATDWVNLNAGTSTQLLIGGTTPSWGAVNLGTMVTGTLGATNGGTAQSTYATGDLLYASASNTLSKRTIGNTNDLLYVTGGVPTWGSFSTLGLATLTGTETLTGKTITMAGNLTVTGFGVILGESSRVDLDLTLSATGTFSAPETTQSFQSASALAIGDIVYLNGSSQWALADASALATAGGIIGVCMTSAGASGVTVTVVLRGAVRATALGTGTAGATAWLSETAGDVTATAPSTSAAVVRIMGRWADTNTLWFAPEEGYVVVA